MLEGGAEADPEELREAMMEAVKEFMEENSESLETGRDAVNFLENEGDSSSTASNTTDGGVAPPSEANGTVVI